MPTITWGSDKTQQVFGVMNPMDLDLERFWKVVRPKRHQHQPPSAPEPTKTMILIEGFNDANEAVTSKVQVELNRVEDTYYGTGEFKFDREVTIRGLRGYLRDSDIEPILVLNCTPSSVQLVNGVTLKLNISIQGLDVEKLLLGRMTLLHV
jgi:hypothetical protein